MIIPAALAIVSDVAEHANDSMKYGVSANLLVPLFEHAH